MSDEIVGPLVSVVIPCFNAERWIVETLNSVSRQTYANIEILVVDDGSTDGGVRLVESAASEDSRIRIIRKSNGGLSSARNCGIREAAGKYVAIVDADDLWHPRKIEKQVARYELAEQQGQQLGFVYCWSNSIDEQSFGKNYQCSRQSGRAHEIRSYDGALLP